MKIAILIPCFNEEVAIQQVILDCQKYLPSALIYVYDNNSKDKTVERAKEVGAIVRSETHQGKGNVVRRMFADIEADIYVLIDGDGTYDVKSIPKMIEKLKTENLDMVTGMRVLAVKGEEAYRRGHQFGNKMITKLVGVFFGQKTNDMLSGLRVFSKRFVKSFPANSKGFEIETELTVHSLGLRLPITDMETPYYNRPKGSVSKLSTYKDGYKILKMIALLIKEERPLLFFGFWAFILFILGIGAFIPVLLDWMKTGLVPRFPTAILSVALILASGVNLAIALILDTVSKTRKEMRRFAYLMYKNFNDE